MKHQGKWIGMFGLAVWMGLSAGGCAERRIAMDYEIQAARTFEYQHVKETETFHSGEKFRLRVTTHEDCYAYIFNPGTTGTFNVLFPHPRINGGSNFVKGWEKIMIPPPTVKQGAYMFDDNPGVETMIMIVSDRPVPELDLIVHGHLTDGAEIEQIIHRLETESKRRGKFKKEHHVSHTQVVLESPNRNAVLINVVRLNHSPARIGQ